MIDMVITMERVLAALYPEEPDYAEAAAKLGSEALPYLEKLVKGDDPGLAAKATSLASLIKDKKSVDVLMSAARSTHSVVRVAAALGAQNLKLKEVNSVLDLLSVDEDSSIRKHAAKSRTRLQM